MKKIQSFLEHLGSLDSEQMMKLVETHLTDDGVECFVDHIQDFYGIDDDEELGTLAQLMVTGYLACKAELGLLDKTSNNGPDESLQ